MQQTEQEQEEARNMKISINLEVLHSHRSRVSDHKSCFKECARSHLKNLVDSI